jgi:NitT/TauT family transport system substrate-binding protein
LGVDHSNFPANSFVVRREDLQDPERKKLLEQYMRGWAMGMEFAHQNPLAATEIVFKQFPIVKKNLGAELGTESMMQLANVFRGDMSERQGWGWHDMTRWELFFKTLEDIGQLKKPVDVSSVVTNELVGPANNFDMAKVKADAAGYKLSADMAAVDLDAIKKRFFANAIR